VGSGGIDWLLGPVDGFKDAAFDVSIEIRCDAETTATRPTDKCWVTCECEGDEDNEEEKTDLFRRYERGGAVSVP